MTWALDRLLLVAALAPLFGAEAKPTAKCADHPKCAAANITGACCPDTKGSMLDCCEAHAKDSKSIGVGNATEGDNAVAQCSAYPKCVKQGLTGECCPSAGGSMLDCCRAECSRKANKRCTEAGRQGYCCPTMKGDFLECCGKAGDGEDDDKHEDTQPKDADAVAKHPKAKGGVLVSDPLADGDKHDDRDGTSMGVDNATEGDNAVAQCSAYPKCVKQGLTGECCRSAGGSMLDCCKAECSKKKHKRCTEAGLEGYCCPTMQGDFLECCGKAGDSEDDDKSEDTQPKPADAPKKLPEAKGGRVLSADAEQLVDGNKYNAEDGESIGLGNATEGDNAVVQCSAYPMCVKQGLTGECCPSAGGSMLDCCKAECSRKKHKRCTEAGLEGYCCPTMEGDFLECCGKAEGKGEDERPGRGSSTEGDDDDGDEPEGKVQSKPLFL